MLLQSGLAKNFKNNSLRESPYKKGTIVQFNKLSSAKQTKKLAFSGSNPRRLAEFLYNVTRFTDNKEPGEKEKLSIIDHMSSLIQEKMKKTEKGSPLVFAMPSFPFKSPSREKTLSDSADAAEKESISFLKKFMGYAEKSFGDQLKLKIYSDGIFFAPIKKVDYAAVIKYSDDIRKLIGDDEHIELVSLDKLYPEDFKAKAKEIVDTYGRSIEEVKKDVKKGGLLNNKFNGIHRFYTEELKGQFPSLSLNQCKKQGKDRAYKVIQGAETVNSWIADREPNAVRFSVHPQDPYSSKINIPLTPSAQNITPWHSSAVKIVDKLGKEKVLLMKAQDAKEQGFDTDDDDDVPNYFKAPAGQNVLVKAYCESHQPPGLIQ